MASTATQAEVLSLPLRLSRLSPAGLCTGAALLAVLGLFLVEWVGEPRYNPTRLFLVLIPAYLASLPLVLRGSLHSLEALPMLEDGTRDSFRKELCRLPLSWIGPGMLVGSAVHMMILSLGGLPWFRPASPRPGDVLVFAAAWPHALALGFTMALLVRQGRLFMGLGRAIDRVDLLDPTSFAPFVQVALRLALVLALTATAAIGFHTDWRDLSLAPQMALILPPWLVLQGLVFSLPLWGVHTRLGEERGTELARVNAAIRGDRSALRGSLISADADSVSTVELLQYRSQVEDFPTWPFSTGALARLALYVVIPVSGWIAAALVERLVDTVLAG